MEKGRRNLQLTKSPSFLRPKEIKFRKKTQKTKSTPLIEVDINQTTNCRFLVTSPKISRNPFRRNDPKRKRHLELEEDDNSLLWSKVNGASEKSETKKPILPSPIIPSLIDESAVSEFSFSGITDSNIQIVPPKLPVKNLPIDWSLKTKIRFTSRTSFPSRGSFRTFEEVNGTIGFVRCLHSGDAEKSSDVHTSHGSKFFQHCLVWMHPSIPWLNLFPRMGTNSSNNRQSGFVVTPSIQEVLHSKWCDSFRSLYQLVRLYQCPYFYLCAPTFTVLFRCAGTASIPVIHALISPTTKGLRKALKEEGITFSMPLCENKEDSLGDGDIPEETPSTESKNECDDEEREEEPGMWLESLGLSQDDFPSLNKSKRRSDPSLQVDNRPESLVYVEDMETQALVNFLLNSHFCTSIVGPLAGIPPTLLSPIAFLGGTLQPLQMRHGKVRQDNEELDSIEVNGPLLPNTVHSLCALLGHTQEGRYSAILTSHQPTSAFSKVHMHSDDLPSIFAQNNLTDCGLPEAFVQAMCAEGADEAVATVTVENGLFSWT